MPCIKFHRGVIPGMLRLGRRVLISVRVLEERVEALGRREIHIGEIGLRHNGAYSVVQRLNNKTRADAATQHTIDNTSGKSRVISCSGASASSLVFSKYK